MAVLLSCYCAQQQLLQQPWGNVNTAVLRTRDFTWAACGTACSMHVALQEQQLCRTVHLHLQQVHSLTSSYGMLVTGRRGSWAVLPGYAACMS
jgi:hypothetical protein